MSEDAVYTERKQNDNIILQFGYHSNQKEYREQYRSFLQGNLDANNWPDEGMKSRLIKEQPETLAIDGMSSESHHLIVHRYKEWLDLPLRPRELNSKGVVNVLCGDIALLHLALDMATVSPKVRDLMHNKYMQSLNSTQAKALMNIDIGLAMGIGYAAQTVGSMMEGENKNDTSRRSFLRRAGKGINTLGKVSMGLGTGAGITRMGILKGNTFINDQTTYNAFLYVTEKLGPKIFGTAWWADGRTALLIAKSKGAHLGKTAVVMGSAHMFNSLDLLQNRDARMKAIRTMRDNMHGLIHDIQKDFLEVKDLDLVSRFDEYLPRYDIVEFSDPGDKPVKPEDLETEGYVKKLGSHISQEVLEAIS